MCVECMHKIGPSATLSSCHWLTSGAMTGVCQGRGWRVRLVACIWQFGELVPQRPRYPQDWEQTNPDHTVT